MAGEVVFSWCELAEKLREDYARGSAVSYSISTAGGSRSFSFESREKQLEDLRYAEMRCNMERGQAPYIGRTCGATRSR